MSASNNHEAPHERATIHTPHRADLGAVERRGDGRSDAASGVAPVAAKQLHVRLQEQTGATQHGKHGQ